MVNYRYLGNSGLKISEITYGNWLTHGSQVENDAATACVRAALDAGITHLRHRRRLREHGRRQVLGDALTGERRESPGDLHQGLLAHRARGPQRHGPVPQAHHGVDQRLADAAQTDYVDLYQAHRYDVETPLEETMQAFADVVRQGKALYIGVSEWTADQIRARRRAGQGARLPAHLLASRSTRCCGGSSRTRSCPPRRSSASRRSSGRRWRRACSPASTCRASRRRRLAGHGREGRRRRRSAAS